MIGSFPFALELCDEVGASDPWLREENEDQICQDPIEVTKRHLKVFFLISSGYMVKGRRAMLENISETSSIFLSHNTITKHLSGF